MKINYLSNLTARLKAAEGQWVLLWYKDEPYWGRLCLFDAEKKHVRFDHWFGVMQGVKTLSLEHITGMVGAKGEITLLEGDTKEQRYTITWRDSKKVEASWSGNATSEKAFIACFRRASGLRAKPRGATITTAVSVPEQKKVDELTWDVTAVGVKAECRWGTFLIEQGAKIILYSRRKGEMRNKDRQFPTVDEAKKAANATMKAWRDE